ncbi:nuclear pore complex protein Nup133 [Coccinella septempunctata]|uniref:nuclear pore complex protein Nup133 n=1 Tax=Coccinella septempunctata TaxID=41139 RepID=UPI001D063BCA|nr:nuclear pore complex protein Nup133 [Coccinella septempunctata]
MDRSFQNTSLTKSPLLTQSPFNRTGKRGVAPSPFRKSSRWSVSGKSTQSVQVVFKTHHNSVERFGQPLPVLITETLTFADRKTVVSAAISEYGYAWVVCGRRLLIWQYRQNVQGLSGTPQRKHAISNLCFELQLPQSDLSHRAELVAVFLTSGSHAPSCIAVSPEGLIRYWPSVSHEDVSIEQTIDLQGQECDSLTEVEGLGCILATTTCSIVLVQPQLIGGRHTLNCHSLKAPTGWLGGISKKMSSFIFGPISSEHSAETRLVRVHSISNQNGSWTVFILAGHSLQKWKISPSEPEQLIYMVELNKLVRDHYRSAMGENCVGELDTWILDLQHDKDNLILLTAAVNMPYSPQIHYALISIPISNSQPNIIPKEFKVLKIMEVYREDNPSETLSYKFLWCNNCIYLFNQKKIIVLKSPEEQDVLEFNSPQDLILGGSVCVNTPIFFLKNNGLVSVIGSDMSSDLNLSMANASLEQSMNETTGVNNLSVYHLDPMEIYNAYTDTLGQMKAAFIFHIKNQISACQDIVNELFPSEAEMNPSIDSVLDKVVISLCRDIINDKPACDPRWTNDVNPGIGSSYSMQISTQLQDKHKALNLFCKFLRETNLWNRLGAHTYRDGTLATVYILGEFSEKVVAAIQLRTLPTDQILEKAIDKAVEGVEIDSEFGLTNQDVFYSNVNSIHKGIQELVNGCSDIVHSDMNPGEISSTICKTNTIVLNVLKEVLQYRKNNSEIFAPQEAALSLAPDYLFWTSANGSEGLADSLWDQHNFTYNYAMKYTSNRQLRHDLSKQLVSLIDIILDGRKNHVHSIRNTHRRDLSYKQYCLDRYKLILPLIEEKEWESATQLAEKFLDFDCLIRICELTDNQQRLDEYMNRFQNEGFTEHVYNWYLKENKQAKLIERCRKLNTRNAQKLAGFLGQHPSLLWMQQIFEKQFALASLTLSNLSEKETDSLTKQKTMYSLAKLAKLAAPIARDTDSFLEKVNGHLELISYQEDIPDYVLQNFGYNTADPQVLSPKEIINLYICTEYADSSELEFKKALDVLKYIDSTEEREEMYLRIWRHALLKDSWQYSNLDSPMDILQNTLIFKTVDIAISMGTDADLLIPPVEILLDDESVDHLRENKACVYLLKAGYEHIQRILSC